MRTSGSAPLAAAYADRMAEVMVVDDDNDTVASVVVSYPSGGYGTEPG